VARGVWTWVTPLISMIVTGGYDLPAIAGGTANQEPAIGPLTSWRSPVSTAGVQVFAA
jgi:hypothetical protein